MNRIINVNKVQEALDRAARNAVHGPRDVRAGRILSKETTVRLPTRTTRTIETPDPLQSKSIVDAQREGSGGVTMGDNVLWSAIYDLYELLIDKVNEEAAYRAYFLKHPIVFSALGYDTGVPFDQQSAHKLPFDEARDYRPEPDFLCGDRLKQVLTIFELKTPFGPTPTMSRSDGHRRKFRATVESHLSQASEYVDSIREREAARKVVCDALGMADISSYRISILYGLTNANDAGNVARLTANRIPATEILPYDSLLDLLARHHALGQRYKGVEPGWSFVFHIMLPEHQNSGKAYILDVGSSDRDRASIFIENGSLVFEVVDARGTSYKSQHCSFAAKESIYLRWEFSTGAGGMLISCNIGNEEVDFRQGAEPIDINLNASQLSLGADLRYNSRARFSMLEHYIVPRTMNIEERLGSFHYFKKKTTASQNCLEFDGTKAMRRNEDGHLVAIDDASKPIFREVAKF